MPHRKFSISSLTFQVIQILVFYQAIWGCLGGLKPAKVAQSSIAQVWGVVYLSMVEQFQYWALIYQGLGSNPTSTRFYVECCLCTYLTSGRNIPVVMGKTVTSHFLVSCKTRRLIRILPCHDDIYVFTEFKRVSYVKKQLMVTPRFQNFKWKHWCCRFTCCFVYIRNLIIVK